ncbi:MAG TPA: MarR family transcriptional regulator [Spirochaetia bacterium]|nr:MarR family transcriptional regulator [Spirochaetia bacterium]
MEGREQFVKVLRDWMELFTNRSMSDFFLFVREQGLSMAQVGPLFHVNRKGVCGVSDVAEDLGVSNAAASQMLERLVQGGLVERREDPNDRRAKQIVLTDRAHAILHNISDARLRWLRALADELTIEEVELARKSVTMLIERTERLDRTQTEPVAPGVGTIPSKETAQQ